VKPIDAAQYMQALDRMHAADHGKGWGVDGVAAYATALLAFEHQLLACFSSEVLVYAPEPERTLRLVVDVPGHETLTCETRLPPLGDNLTVDWITRHLRAWLHEMESGVVRALSTGPATRVSDHFYASEAPPAD
jgi:hypothetical protein